MHDVVKRGTVKFFDTTTGHGYIARDDGAADIYMHAVGVAWRESWLRAHHRVQFVEKIDKQGRKCAAHVWPLDERDQPLRPADPERVPRWARVDELAITPC